MIHELIHHIWLSIGSNNLISKPQSNQPQTKQKLGSLIKGAIRQASYRIGATVNAASFYYFTVLQFINVHPVKNVLLIDKPGILLCVKNTCF